MEQIDWSKAPDWADRVVKSPIRLKLFWANNNERRALDDSRFGVDGQHVRDNWEVVERRPAHFPARPPETFMCRCVAAPVSCTIEQRITSLRALEKQVEETCAELTRDLEALGLTWMVRDEPEQPTITDWRDLRVGDVIWVGGRDDYGDIKGDCEILEVDSDDDECPFRVIDSNGDDTLWPPIRTRKWRFIRRP